MPRPINDLIVEARKKSGGSRNTKSIVTELLYGKLWDETTGDPIVHRQVMRVGWDHYVASHLKTVSEVLEETGMLSELPPDQLDLWPSAVRTLVRSIDRAGVFVPSADEYMKLVPDQITHEQVTEAGLHLINHGKDSIRRGKRLVRLGGLPWGSSS